MAHKGKVYWVSFRLDDTGKYKKTYENRRHALEEAVYNCAAPDSASWSDTTSFIVIDSLESIDHIASECRKSIFPLVDLVLIGAKDFKSCRIVGNVEDQEIFDLFEGLKQV